MGKTRFNLNGLDVCEKNPQWFNNATFFDYYYRLKELAINQFEWINLPPTCDARFLELILFEFGYALFFQDHLNKGFFTLQCTLEGPLNMYRVPIRRRAYDITGFNQQCDDQDSVIIWNNYLRQPTALSIQLFAERLTNIQRAIDVNINGQKTPLLLYGTEAQQKTLKAVYDKYDGNYPVIFGDKHLQENPLTCIKTDVPERYPQLMIAKNMIWNEALTFLGIDNANIDKKERLITDEVESNEELLRAQRFTMLNARKDACKWINELFADELEAEVDVRYRQYGGGENPWQNTQQNSEQFVNQSPESKSKSD